MDLREELTRQGLLLEFIAECVSLQHVPDLAQLVTSRRHWICDYDTCTVLLPDKQGLTLWSQNRAAGASAQAGDDGSVSPHRSVLDDAMARGLPTLAHHADRDLFLAALPLGSRTLVHGALCVARKANRFSQGDIRHLQHACSAVGGALTRIAALAAESEAERTIKLAEAELRAVAEDRALLAEQMVGIVSHDLRNPLSAILMGATLIGMGETLPDAKERVLQRVQRAAHRAQRLVDELLDFTQARIGQGLTMKLSDVDLDELMSSITGELRLSFADIGFDPPGAALGSAYLDADRIHQLFGNLVANAAMYGAPGKPVRLRCDILAGTLTLSVHNQGDSIPPAMLTGIFEPMVRGQVQQSGQRGVGLGLFIVRSIAEGHHGTVGVTSNDENGTCFTVRIPVDCRAA